ncbi:MAG: hypothetical protein ACF8NJ_08025 [Phycisphaerales bacterium JB038]
MHYSICSLLILVVLASSVAAQPSAGSQARLPHVGLEVDAAAQPRSPSVKTRATYRFPESDVSATRIAAGALERVVWFGEVVWRYCEGLENAAA